MEAQKAADMAGKQIFKFKRPSRSNEKKEQQWEWEYIGIVNVRGG